MTVQELIEQLNQVTDKSVNVYMFYSGNNNLDKNGSHAFIDYVNDDLGGRVDINCVD